MPSSLARVTFLCLLSGALTGCDACGKAPSLLSVGSAAPRPGPASPPSSAAPPRSAEAGARPRPTRYLKGQLHAHSNKSGDSHTDPEEVTAFYAAHGFDFLVLTDHYVITVTPSPPGLLVLPGVEITQNLITCEPPPADPEWHCFLHVNALLVEPRPGRMTFGPLVTRQRTEIYGRAVERALSYGGIAQLNHPNFQGGADLDVVLALARQGLTLMEIENQSVAAENGGSPKRPSTEALWDAALSAGAKIYGTATDDAHHYSDAAELRARGKKPEVGDLGWVMVRAEPSAESIREALKSGDFYASTGLFFDRLELGPEAIAVDVREDGKGAPLEIALIGAGKVLETTHGASVRLDPRRFDASYLRIRVTDSLGRKAFSQPLFRGAQAPLR
jgi:hypothetical protein